MCFINEIIQEVMKLLLLFAEVCCHSCKGQSAGSKEEISQPHQEGIGSTISLSSLSDRASRVGLT